MPLIPQTNIPSRCISITIFINIAVILILLAQPIWAQQGQQLLAKQQALQQDIDKLQTWLSNAHKQESQLNKQLAQSEKNIGKASKQIHAIKGDLNKLKEKSSVLQGQASSLQENLLEQEQHLANFLRQQYQIQQRRQSIFSLTENSDIGRMMANFRYLHQAQAEQLAAYRSNLDTLNIVRQQQADTKWQLEQKLPSLEQQQQQLVSAKQQQQQAIAQLKQRRQNKTKQLTDSQAAQEQIKQLLAQIEQALKKSSIDGQGQPFKQRKGKLGWPLKGKVLNRFGIAQNQFPLSENGWLIAADIGSDVYSIHAGQVVFADWLKGYGLLLIIEHGDSFLTLYGQNQSLYKEVGDKVAAGELIAISGKSGGQLNEGLYFSIRKDGQPQNPIHWLEK